MRLRLPARHCPAATDPRLRFRPAAPAYLAVLPPGAQPTTDVYEFLDALAHRLGMLRRGGVPDQSRAAQWFIRWWREQGSLATAAAPQASFGADLAGHRRSWDFDFEWAIDATETAQYDEAMIQRKMEDVIDMFEAEVQEEEAAGGGISSTQEKRKKREILVAKRAAKMKARSPAGKRSW